MVSKAHIYQKLNLSGLKDLSSKSSWSDLQSLLKKLGFVCLSTNDTIRMHSLEYKLEEETPDSFELWHHPLGLMMMCDSYTTGGYVNEQGEEVPLFKSINSNRLIFQIDMGFCNKKYNRVLEKLDSLQFNHTHEINSWGSSILKCNESSNEHCFLNLLSIIQDLGSFVPCEEWNKDTFIYIEKEMYTQWGDRPSLFGKKEKEICSLLGLEIEEKRLAFIQSFHTGLRELLDTQSVDVLIRPRADAQTRKREKLKQDVLENIGHYFSQGGYQWPTEEDKAILKSWVKIALDFESSDEVFLNNNDWSKSIQGFSLIHILIQTQPDRVLNIIPKMPLNRVEKWVTEPHIGGLTLPLQMIEIAFRGNNNIIDFNNERSQNSSDFINQCFSVLEKKLGLKKLNEGLETDKISLLGLLIESFLNNSAYLNIRKTEILSKINSNFETLWTWMNKGLWITPNVKFVKISKKSYSKSSKEKINFEGLNQVHELDCFSNDEVKTLIMPELWDLKKLFSYKLEQQKFQNIFDKPTQKIIKTRI